MTRKLMAVTLCLIIALMPCIALAEDYVYSSPTPETPAPVQKNDGPGIRVIYKGGNVFATTESDTPSGVEIDGQAVAFVGDGSEFEVNCIKADSHWVTVKWGSTSVTVSFTPDEDIYCNAPAKAVPKTGGISVAVFAAVAVLAAAGVVIKK